MANYHSLKNAAIIAPVTNTDLGSPTNRYDNIYMSGDINMSGVTVSSSNVIAPRISSVAYVGDDTAAGIAGGETIILVGSGFNYGASVYISGNIVSVVSVVSSTQITFTSPAKAAGNYALVVVNPDGASATFVPGIQYSGLPTWTTSAGSLGAFDGSSSFTATLEATSDSTVTYSIASGELPSGITLNSATGFLSGTMPAVTVSTTYNFTVRATDGENQSTDRNFSVNVTAAAAPGQVEYTSAGTYSWTVPAGVTTVSAVCIGAGASHPGGGGGGGLRYINALPVTPGETLSVIVGQSYFYSLAQDSSINRSSNILVYGGGAGLSGTYNWYAGTGSTIGAGSYGGTIGGGDGGLGFGTAGNTGGGGGGGAGGYSGNGGTGGKYSSTAPQSGSGGGAGGGGGGYEAGAGGGGVGIYGEGTSGAAGSTAFDATAGIGGSSGTTGGVGADYRYGGNGGSYGGGGGGKAGAVSAGSAGYGANGAVRIIWGAGRAFPSTRTVDE